jgi:NAD-dependent SIR2 family protein deacetylase
MVNITQRSSINAPTEDPVPVSGLDDIARLVQRSHQLLVLTGAGCSTESGIPDYRDRDGAWKRKQPMSYQEFIGSHEAQQRYWARAVIGWKRLRNVQPNRSHRVLARLERLGRVQSVITQNVDGLHQSAGSIQVLDLHGRIDAVECLRCRRSSHREPLQQRLEQLNPQWSERAALMAPDGDAVIDEADCGAFQIAGCEHCEGPLKPAVVFFGESIPSERVARAERSVQTADALLVVGSSLMVYSGYRLVRSAHDLGLPIMIINQGKTRADALVSSRLEGQCGLILERLEAIMIGSKLGCEDYSENIRESRA